MPETIADPLVAAIPLFPKQESQNINGLVVIALRARASVLTRRTDRADVPGRPWNAAVFGETYRINQKPGGCR